MHRTAAYVLPVFISCAVGVGTAAAGPWDIELAGPIEKDGRADISISAGKVDGTPVHRYRWEFRRLAVRCSGNRRTAKLPVVGGFSANAEFDQVGDHWGVSGTRGVGPDGTYETKVSGRLVTRKKARGWVRVLGTAVDVRGGGNRTCDSGRLHWIARSGR